MSYAQEIFERSGLMPSRVWVYMFACALGCDVAAFLSMKRCVAVVPMRADGN